MLKLDYLNSCWGVYYGERPIPGDTIIMVGGGIRRLLEWCASKGINKVELSPMAKICFDLEYDYPIKEYILNIIN